MTNFEKVKKFMQTFGQDVKEKAGFPNEKITNLRIELIEEELKEFKEAIRFARDPMTGQSKLVDVLLNLQCFPVNWNKSNQIVQFLQKHKKNINIDL